MPELLAKLLEHHGPMAVIAVLAISWGWWERRQNAKWQERFLRMQTKLLDMATAQTASNAKVASGVEALREMLHYRDRDR